MKYRTYSPIVYLITLLFFPTVQAYGADGFCATHNDLSVIYCDDFSGSDPLAAYTVTNPYPPNGPHAPYNSIGVTDETLVFSTSNDFSVAIVQYNQSLEWQNTSFESDLKFESGSLLRNLMGIGWRGLGNQSQDYIVWDLQLDEQQAYLFVVLNGQEVVRRAVPHTLNLDQYYHLRLEVEGNNKIKGYIDGILQFAVDVDLSAFPPFLNPHFGGNSHGGPVQQIYDNAIIRNKPVLSCIGFEPPMDKELVKVNKNRALPLKAQLKDNHGTFVTNINIPASPVVQITYDPPGGPVQATDVSDLALPAGLGTSGNQFEFHDGKWQFNLLTKNYMAPGIYTINIAPGDNYLIDPACITRFQID